MSAPQYRCGSPLRRERLRQLKTINGIDYLEVIDRLAEAKLPDSPRQQTLLVHLFLDAPASLTASNVTLTGGTRTPVEVRWAYPATAVPPTQPDGSPTLHPDEAAELAARSDVARLVVVRVDRPGDYSDYRLSLARSEVDPRPLTGFDPLLSEVVFSFKVECPSPFDCATGDACPPAPGEAIEIDYLAKDYGSFRRLMLDRMSATIPGWRERNTADVGVMLVELLAYAGDHLSYHQDAVANEAYLGTAQRRISVRRHARLLDYRISDGRNARVWIAVAFSGPAGTLMPAGTQLMTRVEGLPQPLISAEQADAAWIDGARIFHTLTDRTLDPELSWIEPYTWGDDRCCLPRGATRATLINDDNRLRNLARGDVLIFSEVTSPSTGLPADADPAHRHAVRLTSVRGTDGSISDPLYAEQGGHAAAQRLLEIEWDPEDALPFPVSLWRVEAQPGTIEQRGSGAGTVVVQGTNLRRLRIVIRIVAGGAPGSATFAWSADGGRHFGAAQPLPVAPYSDGPSGIVVRFAGAFVAGDEYAFGPRPATVVLGNVVLADHGRIFHELLPTPLDDIEYRPRLGRFPLTQQPGIVDSGGQTRLFPVDASARAAAVAVESNDVRAAIVLVPSGTPDAISLLFAPESGAEVWRPVPDIMESDAFAPDFVVEVDNDGSAWLRFGDDVRGRRPAAIEQLEAWYRVGNGSEGNIAAGTIAHIVVDPLQPTQFAQVDRVTNPLAAGGGDDPETIEQVKVRAPQAFRVQERAVTVADYALIAERHPGVAAATATRRWTGSWYTIFVTIDRVGGLDVDAPFRAELSRWFERYRLVGQDVEIEGAIAVPLDIALHVCAEPGRFNSHLEAALLDVFSSGIRADGSRGFFHADNFTIGQTVYLSSIVATAAAVPGVRWIDVDAKDTRFGRLWHDSDAPSDGVLRIGRLEVARLDNDPRRPENGRIEFHVEGGL